MKTYIITSEQFTGELEFRYSETGQMMGHDNRTGFSPIQHDWLLKHMPCNETELKQITLAMRGKITEIRAELTFEQFWKQYFAGRGKDNSSKKRAEVKWNRMSKGEQAKAYAFIHAYMSRIAYGTQPKHAETYLNSELWNG